MVAPSFPGMDQTAHPPTHQKKHCLQRSHDTTRILKTEATVKTGNGMTASQSLQRCWGPAGVTPAGCTQGKRKAEGNHSRQQAAGSQGLQEAPLHGKAAEALSQGMAQVQSEVCTFHVLQAGCRPQMCTHLLVLGHHSASLKLFSLSVKMERTAPTHQYDGVV